MPHSKTGCGWNAKSLNWQCGRKSKALRPRWWCVLLLGVTWKTCSRLYGSLVFTAGGRLESVMMCLFGCFAELFTLPQYRVWQVCTCSGVRRGIWYLFW